MPSLQGEHEKVIPCDFFDISAVRVDCSLFCMRFKCWEMGSCSNSVIFIIFRFSWIKLGG